jgi:Holliday junction resolvasome RuvABC endonuclease subunit
LSTVILGLDASTTNLGAALSHGAYLQWSGQFSYRGPTAKRLLRIEQRLEQLVQQHRPTIVAVEYPVLYMDTDRQGKQKPSRVKAFASLHHVVGITRLVAARHNIRWMDISPTSAKAALANGRATKQQMMQYAAAVAGERVGEHQADAIAVTLAAWNKLQQQALQELAKIC